LRRNSIELELQMSIHFRIGGYKLCQIWFTNDQPHSIRRNRA